MALETTFRELSLSLHKLHEALDALQIIVGDRPPEDGAAVVDELENSMLDLMGALHEATEGSKEGSRCNPPLRSGLRAPGTLRLPGRLPSGYSGVL